MDFDGQATRILSDRQVSLPASVVTVGAFDGVHRGHQSLVRAAVAEARSLGLPAVVWTFDPPPKVFFGRARPLVSLGGKLARLARLGPDFIVLARFCDTYRQRPAEAFLDDLARINPARVHVGEDFRFGARQAGDVNLLARRFDVALATPVRCTGGEVVSSTRIRALRSAGRHTEAEGLIATGLALRLAGAQATLDLRLREEPHV